MMKQGLSYLITTIRRFLKNNTSAEGKEILEVPDKSLLEENKTQ